MAPSERAPKLGLQEDETIVTHYREGRRIFTGASEAGFLVCKGDTCYDPTHVGKHDITYTVTTFRYPTTRYTHWKAHTEAAKLWLMLNAAPT